MGLRTTRFWCHTHVKRRVPATRWRWPHNRFLNSFRVNTSSLKAIGLRFAEVSQHEMFISAFESKCGGKRFSTRLKTSKFASNQIAEGYRSSLRLALNDWSPTFCRRPRLKQKEEFSEFVPTMLQKQIFSQLIAPIVQWREADLISYSEGVAKYFCWGSVPQHMHERDKKIMKWNTVTCSY